MPARAAIPSLSPRAQAHALRSIPGQIGTARPADLHETPRQLRPPEQQHSVAAWALIEAYRSYAYRVAATNPLDTAAPALSSMRELDPRTYGLDVSDDAARLEIDFGGVSRALAVPELLSLLRSCYCGSLSLNVEHIRNRTHRDWFHARIEEAAESGRATDADRLRMLEQLTDAEVFEQYLATKHPKQKRFGLEGCEALVPLVAALIDNAIRRRVDNVIVGMQHRGRLNLMKNALGVPAHEILSLFSDTPQWPLPAWDLRDHLGYSRIKETPHGSARILLAYNPSHLESVSPVICGMARALQDRQPQGGSRVLPLILHGDAAFCGQGIVMETLNFAQTPGYHVGGAIHLILNNQIGSTVSRQCDARSTPYCADIGRAVDAPILRVNADDPEAVCFAATLAIDYRMEFGADVIVDFVGYRRYGHNTHDEPALTQPASQRQIQNHRSVVDLYAEKLMREGLMDGQDVERMRSAAWVAMSIADERAGSTPHPAVHAAPRAPETAWQAPAHTAVPSARLQALLHRVSAVPADLAVHETIAKLCASWRAVASDESATVDWSIAETLAYATLLDNGFSVRLTGLDIGRGTFYERHAVWHDQTAREDGSSTYVPLRHIAPEQGSFAIFDSPLSEEAVLGFEYGYASQCGRDLVIWEAQLGDFVNNAQVIIDQYISSGASKWGESSGVVLLLPHGYEGAGSEHSSAFLGRFLLLCAEENMRVAMPTTSSQFFHLLRSQALAHDRKPLVVMTAKMCLLNQPASHSHWADFANGEFSTVLDDVCEADAAKVARVIVTSGKLFYDLQQGRTETKAQDTPILRVEQLYPFPGDALAQRLARYPGLREVVWAQEEPRNHGAWPFVRDEFEAILPPNVSLRYAGRVAAAASAASPPRQHAAEQQAVVAQALAR